MGKLWKTLHLREVSLLGVPVATEQFLTVLLGTVNTVIASNLGKEAITSIGMSDALNNILVNFFASLAVGGTVVTAHCTGQGNTERARKTTGQSLVVAVSFALFVALVTYTFRHAVLFLLYGDAGSDVLAMAEIYLTSSVLSYPFMAISSVIFGCLRGAGDTRTPMMISISQSIVNIVVSYALIYGVSFGPVRVEGGGIGGAAVALTLVRFYGALLALYAILRRRSVLRVTSLAQLRPEWKVIRAVLSVGIPTGTESILFNIGKMFSQVFLVSLGTVATAANFIASSVFGLFIIPGNALSVTATTMVGQRMGRGEPEEAGRLLRALILMNSVLLCAAAVILFPLAPFIVSLYSHETDVMVLTTATLRDSLLAMLLVWSPSFLIPSGLRAAGDARYTMIVAVSTMWIVRIALGYVFGIILGLGVRGIWLAMYFDWGARGLLFWLRFRSGRWKLYHIIETAEAKA